MYSNLYSTFVCNVCTYRRMYISICMYVCMYVRMYVCTCMYVHECIYVHVLYVCTCMYHLFYNQSYVHFFLVSSVQNTAYLQFTSHYTRHYRELLTVCTLHYIWYPLANSKYTTCISLCSTIQCMYVCMYVCMHLYM